ncbi:MAG: glycosyltransferase family 39 protein, partial [Elusimicrobiota bacterium]|nr:glycosyltransferase family 39 protein [Elusimicrobiota bacterium]
MKKYLKDLFCRPSRKIIWIIIAAGIFMRVEFYRTSPVGIDEYFTSYNIEKIKITEVFEPSGRDQVYNQAQPIGFLIIENVIIKLFGSGKYMLRFFPFLCGIFSLLLFYKVAKLYCEPVAVPIALMFFAVSQELIRYSSIIKPYSCDVLTGLILLFGIKDLQEKPLTRLRIVLWGGVCSAAMWISHAAILILPGLGMVLILDTIRKKDEKKLRNLLILSSVLVINL